MRADVDTHHHCTSIWEELISSAVQVSGTSLADACPWGPSTIGEALLAPTVIYVEPVLKLIEAAAIKVASDPNLHCSFWEL